MKPYVQEGAEPERGPARFEEPLLEFLEQAFHAQVVERERAAEFNSLGRERALEAARELHPAQYAQGIFRKCRAHMAQRMRFQVADAVIRVAEREFGQFHAHRVDGEVAPEGRLPETEFLVCMHHESAVPVTHLALGAREREIERQSLHGEVNHPERFPDQIGAAILRKNRHQSVLRHVVDFNIVVPAGLAQEGIADPTAYQEGTATRVADIARDFQ